jgi:2-polyprenyl-6-methoxyphenol hydroxylase-like FAD-dependent oxidoreductase
MTETPFDFDVIVAGAGPVGLTLAIDLGRRGVRCVLVERKPAPAFLPKMERCNARTMEIYRRMGLAERIRAAGLRADVPMDVFIVLDLARPPLVHHPFPSVERAREQIGECHDGTLALEPYQLISQYTLEPLLKTVAESLPGVDVRFGCKLVEFSQDPDGVSARIETGGGIATLRGRYLVGCDGGTSTVRRQLGIELGGDADMARFGQALFVCDGLFDAIPIGDGPGHGRHYHAADAAASFIIMQDSTRHFTLHAAVEGAAEMTALFARLITVPLPFEMLYCGEWRHNLLLADRYRDGRVFLAGDAAHLMIPTGGLGMNSGIGDAADLGWKLAATLAGWGGPGLLDSYEIERRQVGARNVAASRYASAGRRTWRALVRPGIGDATAAGDAARRALIEVAEIEQRKSNEMIGAELGYRYEDSPILCNEPGGPEPDFRTYRPSAWPGARLPHVWLDDGTAIQDRIPAGGYVLLRINDGMSQDADGLARAFARLGVPFSVLDVAAADARAVYGRDLVLLRPDMHVAWRGDAAPKSPEILEQFPITHGHIRQHAGSFGIPCA